MRTGTARPGPGLRTMLFLPRFLPVAVVFAALSASTRAGTSGSDTVGWFAARLSGTPAGTFPGDRALTAVEAGPVFDRLWADYKAAAVKLGWDRSLVVPKLVDPAAVMKNAKTGGRVVLELPEGVMPAGTETMPYRYFYRGERPAKGRPLFIQMHGGGNTDDKLEGPHAWPANTRDWNAQAGVCLFKFPEGLYFTPRMANDNKGRWWYRHNRVAFDALLRHAVLFDGVDPDRIYFTGISEGAYGTEALTPFWADRVAGGCAMAGGAGGGERFLNLRNTALRNDTGEVDTMYGRRKLAQEAQDYLARLRAADPAGYDHFLNIQAGRGHGVDYAPGPAWIAERVRNPRADKVVWFDFALDGERRTDFAWLALERAPEHDTLIVATVDRKANAVNVTATVNPPGIKDESPVYATSTPAPVEGRIPYAGNTLTVRLDDRLLDLDRPVTVTVNGRVGFQGRVERRLSHLAEDIARTGDPGRSFVGRVVVKL